MARDKGLLTDLQIRHWIKAGTLLAKTDGNGLTFTLSAAGATCWVLRYRYRYRYGGRRRELSIGRYPEISLADARGIATIKCAEVMQGRNPAADKQKAKATAAKDWTVRELVKDYRAKKLVNLAESTQVRYGRHLKRIENKLGALTVREIEASDVVALISTRRSGRTCTLTRRAGISRKARPVQRWIFHWRLSSSDGSGSCARWPANRPMCSPPGHGAALRETAATPTSARTVSAKPSATGSTPKSLRCGASLRMTCAAG